MKKSLLIPHFLFLYSLCVGQHFVPVLIEGDDLNDLSGYFSGDIYDLEVFDDELICGGKFTTFFGQPILKLAKWDGANSSAFEPAPAFSGADRVMNITIFNVQIIIAGKLSNYSGAAIFDGAQWNSYGVDGGNFHAEIIEYNDQLFTYRDSLLYRNDGGIWNEMNQEFVHDISDVEVFDNKLFVAVDSSLFSFNGTTWYNYYLGLNEPIGHLSVAANELFATGGFTSNNDGNALTGVLKITGENVIDVDLNIPAAFTTRGKVYSLFGKKLLTEKYNPSISVMSDPSRYYVEGSPFSIENNFAPSDIVSFNGKQFACVNAATSFSGRGIQLVAGGADLVQLDNGVLKPVVSPMAGHFNMPPYSAGFIYPTPEYDHTATIYAAALWMYGITESDTIVSANTFNNSQNLTAGPIGESITSDFIEKYFRIYHVQKAQISSHIQQYMNPNYNIPEVILNWPAHGNTANEESYYLAPFVDTNLNGVYEPELGDYPVIKGDECAYYILNDKNDFTFDSDFEDLLPDSLNIEVHVMAYLYDSDIPEINHTLFMNYRIINRSDNDYQKFRTAVWTDWDIGNSIDDYVGCDSTLNYYYGYNGDAEDQPATSSQGYGIHPPAAGCLFLNHQMTNSMYYSIGGGMNGDPVIGQHYFYYMNSKWNNGVHMLWGGNGLSNGGATTQEANYMFPTYPWETEGAIWNEQSSGNPPGDRRNMASGEEIFLGSGQEYCFDIAYVMARDTTANVQPQIASLQLLQSYIPVVQQFYDDQHDACYKNSIAPTGENGTEEDEWFQIYPNPGGDQIAIAIPYDGLEHRLLIHDARGRLVQDVILTGDKPFQVLDTKSMADAVYMISLIKQDDLLTRKWLKISEP